MQTTSFTSHRYTRVFLVALLVQTITCAEPANQATGEPVSSNLDSDVKSNTIQTTNKEQTSGRDSFHIQSIPDLAASSQVIDAHTGNIPLTSSEHAGPDDIPNENRASPLAGPYPFYGLHDFTKGDLYTEDVIDYRHDTESVKLSPEALTKEYMLLQVPHYDKRFMRGLKRYEDTPEISEDKRFMRGLPFKRDFNLEDARDGEIPDQEFQEKRFMRGLSQYVKKDDKRFMRGFQNVMDKDKRFMRGLRSLDSDNMEDKRFIIGLNRFARLVDKRFMRGLGNYNKRFIHGLQNYGKRFMRGLVKRDNREAIENKKRFIVGLNGYGRRANNLYTNTITDTADENDDTKKRFMKGFHSFINTSPNKRFMKGFGLYTKKYSPVGDEEFTDEGDVYNEKRFMRGLTKKYVGSDSQMEQTKGFAQMSDTHSGNNNDDMDKRFIKGLVRPDEKRFMRGLVKKPDNSENADKRFMRGLVRKSEDDKRFMRGLNKKSGGSESKRFIKGLVLNDNSITQANNQEESTEKRFMRGLGKKNVEEEELKTMSDKRFMRGLYVKKDSNNPTSKDKKFIKGLKAFEKKADEFTDDDTGNFQDKRFMRGLSSVGLGEKRFIKGLDNNRFGGGGKRFMKGLHNYAKKDTKSQDNSEMIEDKRFMRGLIKKEDAQDNERDEKRFMKGLVKKDGENSSELDKQKFGKIDNDVDKRFMRGLATGEYRGKRETRFFDETDDELVNGYGLVDKLSGTEGSGTWQDLPTYETGFSMDKRFMRGLGKHTKRGHFSDKSSREFDDIEDLSEDDLEMSKRFIRGFLYNNGYPFLPKRLHYTLTNSEMPDSMSGTQKRFIKGLDYYTRPTNGKRFMRGILQYGTRSDDSSFSQDKRFMRGLNPYIRTVDKRFIRGFGKYAKRPVQHTEGENAYSNARFHKRITGHQFLVPDHEQQLADPSFRQHQLMPSYYSDHHTPYQTNFENSLSAGSPGDPSRRILGW